MGKNNRLMYIINTLLIISYYLVFFFTKTSFYHNFLTWLVSVVIFILFLNITYNRIKFLGVNKFSIYLVVIPILNLFFIIYLIFKNEDTEM